jgi:hypothetical protein
MKSWARYDLVAAPADADLVIEIRFTANPIGSGSDSSYAPPLDLAILDVKTHFRLGSITAPVQGAIRKSTWDKNFAKGMAELVEDLQNLTTQSVASGDSINK